VADDKANVVAAVEYEMTLLSRYRQRELSGMALDRSAYLLLGRLELEHPLSLKELAVAFSLDISTINRQVTALVREGLVEYVLDPDGGAARKVQSTPAGLAGLYDDRRHSRDGVERVVAGWSAADLTHLRDLLTRFNTAIEDLQGIHWPRPQR
jgi:DNA-binding MarR family transcriptional regulator